MAMKLALCYLKVTNLGDLVIYDTAHYLVERILRDLGRDDPKADNAKRDFGGLRVRYGKIHEAYMYETKDEIPFYQFKG